MSAVISCVSLGPRGKPLRSEERPLEIFHKPHPRRCAESCETRNVAAGRSARLVRRDAQPPRDTCGNATDKCDDACHAVRVRPRSGRSARSSGKRTRAPNLSGPDHTLPSSPEKIIRILENWRIVWITDSPIRYQLFNISAWRISLKKTRMEFIQHSFGLFNVQLATE